MASQDSPPRARAAGDTHFLPLGSGTLRGIVQGLEGLSVVALPRHGKSRSSSDSYTGREAKVSFQPGCVPGLALEQVPPLAVHWLR
jgi:hypothetical protein